MTIKDYFVLSLCVFFLGCKSSKVEEIIPSAPENSSSPFFQNLSLSTDKATYQPNEEITFSLNTTSIPNGTKVRYKHFNSVISEENVTNSKWTWTAPTRDFTGYMAEVYSESNGEETIYATVGIDVSSNWTKFPRYGFLSKYPQMDETSINDTLSNLNLYHINGLQFYDWQNKHHKPLPLVNGTPPAMWKDIANRDIYFNTVKNYIAKAHALNMKVMYYNLIYGAWENAEEDGVKKEWYVYKDNTHTNIDFHPLSSPFLSNIYLLDPSNFSWQQYAITEEQKVYQFLDFDGFHIDQLGDRGTTFNYNGDYLNLANTFQPFINIIRNAFPNKFAVMNAVNQYGQQGIAAANTSFLYSEVWSPFNRYSDLANLIKQNNTYSNNSKNSVLAAYMNYDLANNKGYFNTPSVLMTDAVIFAFGGSHLELGEHMLGKEYFPNNNLKMKDDLKEKLVKYYDFLVAYENLLRDGGDFNNVSFSSIDGKISLANWPAQVGYVAYFGKKFDSMQVIHLINFTNATTLEWRDNSGIQASPVVVKNAKLWFSSNETIKKIWVASPDYLGGMSRSLNFNQVGNKVSFTLPELQYWDMLVIEY